MKTITLTPLAYRLLKMDPPSPKPPFRSHVITQRDRIPGETQCCGGNSFDRIQTKYHGIPEHLIEARDHD